MIAIIDYGLGNIRAFANVYGKLNIPCRIVKHLDELQGAKKIILPGVGAFDYAMQQLDDSGIRRRLDEMVVNEKIPVLGICVGMQMLAKSSEEGVLPGLGWIDGEVKKFDSSKILQKTHLPHMGWNNVSPIKYKGLFENVMPDPLFYFLHSYYFSCNRSEDIIATTDYSGDFSCAVNASNIYGVQFHPEKSHQSGVQLLKNFATL